MRRSLLSLLAVVAALCAITPSMAGAATVNVNDRADDYNDGPFCSLREAVEATNIDAAFGGCEGGTGADVIVIPTGTYDLAIPGSDENSNATGDLDITDTEALTIVGTGVVAIRGGSSGDRVIHHTGSNAGDLELSNLTISGGNAPGLNDGGGILNAVGHLTMQSSTVQGNSAGVDGGGITNYATMTLRNVTVSGNSAYNDGGGIYGGGGSDTTLSNVTVAFNTTDVDVLEGGDGGGLGGSGSSSFLLFNTLVGDNLDNSSTPAMDTNDCGVFGSMSASYSLFEAVDPNTCVGFTPATNVIGDPLLQTLAYNGGSTRSHALREGSPAIDAGNPTPPNECLPLDQRGVTRPQRAGCDIGAFELPPAPPVVLCGGKAATIVGTSGRNVLRGTPGRDVIAGLGGTDTIRGLGGNDILCGGRGNDALFGNKGNDTLLGHQGKDVLRAAEGRDVLKGGKDDDRIFGGAGRDRLFGGPGRDRLVGGTGRDRLISGPGRDSVTQ